MPRLNINFADPFLPVTKVPLYTGTGEQSSRHAVLLEHEGQNIEVGVVSENYQLVPNEEVHGIALDVLTRTGMAFDDAGQLFDGKHYRNRWVLPDLVTEPRVNDIVQIALDVVNSYDGSTTFGLAFNAQRLICSNGMMLDFMLAGFKFRHLGNDNFSVELDMAAGQILNLAEQLDTLTQKLQALVDQSIDRKAIQSAFVKLKLPLKLQAEIFLGIEEDTAWGFYNAATGVLTKQDTHRADNINRQVSRYLLAA